MQRNSRTVIATLVLAVILALPTVLLLRAQHNTNDDAKAPDFTLTDLHNAPFKLSDFHGKYVVLEWLNVDCPCVKAQYSSGTMQKLQHDYTAKGVVWLSVVSSAPGKEGFYPAQELEQMLAKREAAATAVLIDSTGAVGHLYGARTTPHMFVIDPSGTIIYKGAIDNMRTTDPAVVKEATNYVAAALNEAMAGKPVSVAATQPYGCSVKY